MERFSGGGQSSGPTCRARFIASWAALCLSACFALPAAGQALADDRPAAAEPAAEPAPQRDAQAVAQRKALIKRLSQIPGVSCSGDDAGLRTTLYIYSPATTDATVKLLEPLVDTIRTLTLGPGDFSESAIDTVARCRALRSLQLSGIPFSASAAKQIASLPQLGQLQITDGSQLTDEALGELRHCDELWRLDLGGKANRITDQGFESLAALPFLSFLSISSDSLTDEGLHRLAQSRSLATLSLHGQSFGPAGLRHLKAAGTLEDLRLSDCRQLGNDALAAIGELSQLRRLSIEGGPMTDAGLAHLSHLSRLRSLSLDNSHITGAGLGALAGLFEIGELSLLGGEVSDKVFAHVDQFPNLGNLTVGAGAATKRRLLTDEGLKLIRSAPQLGTLMLQGTAITDRGLESLESLPHLYQVYSWSSPASQHWLAKAHRPLTAQEREAANPNPANEPAKVLEVLANLGAVCREQSYFSGDLSQGSTGTGRYDVEIKDPKTNDETVATLTLLGSVRSLVLTGPQFTDASFDSIANLPNLERLKVSEAKVSPAGMKNLARFSRLESLVLQNCPLTDEALQHLASCPALCYLTLGGRTNQFTDAGFELLAASTLLHSLELDEVPAESLSGLAKSSSISDLDLVHQSISPASLAAVAALANLRTLSLGDDDLDPGAFEQLRSARRLRRLDIARCSQFDDDCLQRIGRLTQLCQLYLEGQAITDVGLARLGGLADLEGLGLTSPHVTGRGLDALCGLIHLRYLQLRGAALSNEVFAHLERLPRLDNLSLDGACAESPGITNEGLKRIGKLRNLTSAHLISTGLTRDGLAPLADLPRLVNVSFGPIAGGSQLWQP